MTENQVIKLFKYELHFMGMDRIFNVTKIRTKTIRHMEGKVIIREWLINDSQFVSMDLHFIEEHVERSAPTLRLLNLLLQLHNTGIGTAN